MLSLQPVKKKSIPDKIHTQHKDFLTILFSFYHYLSMIQPILKFVNSLCLFDQH